MKIELEVNDLKTLIDGLNNAIIAYNEVVVAINLCCDVPSVFEPLKKIPFEILTDRQKALRDIYLQLIQIEESEE